MKKSVRVAPKALPLVRPLILAMGMAAGAGMLTACGGGGDSSSVSAAPVVSGASIKVDTGATATHKISASDPAGLALSYSIKTQPKLGSATIAADGTLSYTAYNVAGKDSVVVSISNGQASAEAAVQVSVGIKVAFDYQFYSVTNPSTLNKQVVRYDPNDSNPASNQKVIKDNVILGSNVFVISGARSGDKTQYVKREYAVFLDPNASSEKRTASDGMGSTYEYTFYKDNILKRFDAADPSSEATIFSSAMLPADAKAQGLKVIEGSYEQALNYTDIANSYVRLKAYEYLPDVLRGEDEESVPHAPMTVRVSDSKVRMGRPVGLIINSTHGKTDQLLFNYIAAHKHGAYPTDPALAQRLQVCSTDLATCTDVAGGAGNYFTLGQSSTHFYLAKQGSTSLYAFDKVAGTLAQVSGVQYPAKFDHHVHLLSSSDSHGGNGITNDFTTLSGIRTSLSEGESAYVAINYDLDLDTPISTVFGTEANYMWKHAMILKFTGAGGVKVYDNGDGVDDMNASGGKDTISDHITLTAVKGGKLFFEAGGYPIEALGGSCAPVAPNNTGCSTLKQGWLDTASGSFPKTQMDNVVSSMSYAYFTANRVPALAVSDSMYLSEATGSSAATRVYNIYKMALDASLSKPSTPTTSGRMFFERTAFRGTGVYDGSVILWNRATSEVFDATNNVLIGTDSSIETEANSITGASAKSTGLAGLGGMFGLKMSVAHGAVPYLVSGSSGQAGSLVKVNQIEGDWIID